MKRQLIALLVLGALAAVGCSKKRNTRNEVVECSSISLDAKGTAQGVACGLRVAPRCRQAQTRFPELPQESRSARQLFARRRLAARPRARKCRIPLDGRPAAAS